MKQKPLSEKQSAFIESYRRNAGNLQKIEKELGITDARRYLQNDRVKEQLRRGTYETIERLQAAAPALLDVAIEMIQNEKTSEKVKSSLILGLMDRAGVIQKAPAVTININTEISDRARQILSQTLPAIPGKATGEPGQN